jgi:Zn-dependent protease with chaperone function
VWAYRSGLLARGLMSTGAGARALERLGRERPGRFPVFVVPGTKMCHATGLLRRRIMLSSDLAARLSPEELTSALAHEEAHLCRRDPLARLVLAVAGLFVPPPLAAFFRRRHGQAAEEACDAVAADRVGDGATVAAALVRVAALQRSTPDTAVTAAAFGGDGSRRGSARCSTTPGPHRRARTVLC